MKNYLYPSIKSESKGTKFSSLAEHVGVLRSSSGNNPNIQNRFAAHRKALAANLFSGTARNHRGNIAASLQCEKTFASPVLFSGLGSLVLTKTEANMVDQHCLRTCKNILKVHSGTPQSVILFISGSLPGLAHLHLKKLSLFSMITHFPGDPLFSRASYVLTSARVPHSRSWFSDIRDICQLYSLPHPLHLLTDPLPKERFKKLIKSKVTDYWEFRLRQEASILPSLNYFKPEFYSLRHPHQILWTPGPNPHEVSKSLIQLKMLSGRYRVARLTRHWNPNNKSGCCPAPGCSLLETLEHLLVSCNHYAHLRFRIKQLWYSTSNLELLQIVTTVLNSQEQDLVQFLLDPSVHPQLISLVQVTGVEPLKLAFYLTRTWCFSLHCERMRLMKRLS